VVWHFVFFQWQPVRHCLCISCIRQGTHDWYLHMHVKILRARGASFFAISVLCMHICVRMWKVCVCIRLLCMCVCVCVCVCVCARACVSILERALACMHAHPHMCRDHRSAQQEGPHAPVVGRHDFHKLGMEPSRVSQSALTIARCATAQLPYSFSTAAGSGPSPMKARAGLLVGSPGYRRLLRGCTGGTCV